MSQSDSVSFVENSSDIKIVVICVIVKFLSSFDYTSNYDDEEGKLYEFLNEIRVTTRFIGVSKYEKRNISMEQTKKLENKNLGISKLTNLDSENLLKDVKEKELIVTRFEKSLPNSNVYESAIALPLLAVIDIDPMVPLPFREEAMEPQQSLFYSKFMELHKALSTADAGVVWSGNLADEITRNYKNYLIIMSNIFVTSALILTFVHGLSQLLASSSERFSDPPRKGLVCETTKNVTLDALTDTIQHAKALGVKEITFLDLYEKTGFNGLNRSFFRRPHMVKPTNAFYSFLFSWNFFASCFISIGTFITGFWRLFDVFQPFFQLCTALNVWILLTKNRRREKRKTTNEKEKFIRSCVVGWNIFERFIDPDTMKERARLIMPTETTFIFEDLLKDSCLLYESLTNQMIEADLPLSSNQNPGCPDFFVVLPSVQDQMDLVRRIWMLVNETVKTSQFIAFAQRRKSNPHVFEQALFVVTCEKEANEQVRYPRVWIIFPSELKMLLNYSLDEIEDKNGYFFVEKDHWRVRLQNLYLWAKAEFEEVMNENGTKEYKRKAFTPYASQPILLPLN
eukprot:CAMPEP_0173166542 /NCGR_PEP_ID=MMETSP1105-20130129/22078_1 /TAXON_ID=2985 /ORGANISM="Ochromonas sp., Strain BG-1" /LENGTH=567 /DNA_ID=CAMNT_0014087809 /DNA_START=860 /DNA_END=2564 /DNA_ORIENTATION=+